MHINVPGLWMMTWYDVSVAPNLAAYNFVRSTASPEVANEQYAIIAPVPHCSYKRAAEHTIVGERDLGDARLDYDALTFGWFDHFLKGEDNGLLEKTPKVRYYTMGLNKWQSSDTWPPKEAKPVTFYLSLKRPRQFTRRRWSTDSRSAAQRRVRQIPLRSHEPGSHARRRILLHGRRLQTRRRRSASS